ncbi:MAG: plastocyanin/azurin family copper-binding protein [Actinobacteria bacterium]|nr:plastocyanin/azurin family copper-binding protein [Actinomycetota bacterium]
MCETATQTAGGGQTFEVRFDEVGTYLYYCLPHRSLGMTGTIIVE